MICRERCRLRSHTEKRRSPVAAPHFKRRNTALRGKGYEQIPLQNTHMVDGALKNSSLKWLNSGGNRMRRTLTIDIETLPALEMTGNGLSALQTAEDHLKTALSGDFGRILCIGYIDEDPGGRIESGVLGWDEQD